MGIFSFFTREAEDDDDELAEEQTTQLNPRLPENAPTGQLFGGMQLDVTTKDGEVLFSGQITKQSATSLTLNRLPGQLSFKILPLESAVSLCGYDKKLIPINLSGAVEESTRTCFKVKDLKIENHAENRDNFRLPISVPVSVYRKDDEHFRNPEECELVNISTGGCCIQTEYVHVEDEVVRIRVKLQDYAPLNFLGQVVRCSERDKGLFRYGILFAQLTEQEITTLSKTLYNLQMGVRDTHMRNNPGQPGHW